MRRTHARILSGVLTVGSLGIAAMAGDYTVNANQGPWVQAINPNDTWGQDDNQPPTAIPVSPGTTVTIAYLGGLVSACAGCPNVDANGELDFPTNNYIGPLDGTWPSRYMSPYPIYVMELVGSFANNGVICSSAEGAPCSGSPFAIGDGPATFLVPNGANQLLLGVNDNYYPDNSGSFSVSVVSSSSLPAAMPIGVRNVIEDVENLQVSGCSVIKWTYCFSAQQNFWISSPGSPRTPSFWVQNAFIVWQNPDGKWWIGHAYYVWNFSIGPPVGIGLIACNGTAENNNCIGGLDFTEAQETEWFPTSTPLELTSTLSQSLGSEILTLDASFGGNELQAYTFSGTSSSPLPINSSVLAATTAQEAEQFTSASFALGADRVISGVVWEPELILVGISGGVATFSGVTTGEISTALENISDEWQTPGTQYAIFNDSCGFSEIGGGLYWSPGNLTDPVAFQSLQATGIYPAEGVKAVPAEGAGPVAFATCQCGPSDPGLCSQNLQTVP